MTRRGVLGLLGGGVAAQPLIPATSSRGGSALFPWKYRGFLLRFADWRSREGSSDLHVMWLAIRESDPNVMMAGAYRMAEVKELMPWRPERSVRPGHPGWEQSQRELQQAQLTLLQRRVDRFLAEETGLPARIRER